MGDATEAERRAGIERCLAGPTVTAGGGARLMAGWIETPIGPMLAIGDGARLRLLDFADRPELPAEIARLKRAAGAPVEMGRAAAIDRAAAELAAYFAGQGTAFSVPLDPPGTAFQRAVWAALRAIPSGETQSYSALAAAIGRPTAVRAAARANGANAIAILVPCHRVLGAGGALTGYGGGLWRKRWLLDHEARMAGSAPQPPPAAPPG